MPDRVLNPAELAAAAADARVLSCLTERRSFRLEAGAGAGKTHSLILALQFLIRTREKEYAKGRKRVACITYTNVAKAVIDERTDGSPVVFSGTIHSFCWILIQDFQPQLRTLLPSIGKWPERIAEAGELGMRRISYNLGHPKIKDQEVLLGHDDVLALTAALLPIPKFRRLLIDRFPVLFIDEYQDTSEAFATAIREHLIAGRDGMVVGLFGDAWQKIYEWGCGGIDHPSLEFIGKESNFRSAPRIVEALNRIRPDLPQHSRGHLAGGSLAVFHTNGWPGQRRNGQHWAGDLQAPAARQAFESAKTLLAGEGWSFAPDKGKILALTHRALAGEIGYDQLATAFEYNDEYLKKENPHIAFFVDKLEPACAAFSARKFGTMFSILGADDSGIRVTADKAAWTREMEELIALRRQGSIGQIIDLLRTARHVPFPESLSEIDRAVQSGVEPAEDEPASHRALRKMRVIPYSQVIALGQFIEGHTPFQTQHGVKGDQFENVFVVFGRGWNRYNFGEFLEFNGQPPADGLEAYIRNRNLFYVVCSRPEQRLALLFTQMLSPAAIQTLRGWFGAEAVRSLPPN